MDAPAIRKTLGNAAAIAADGRGKVVESFQEGERRRIERD